MPTSPIYRAFRGRRQPFEPGLVGQPVSAPTAPTIDIDPFDQLRGRPGFEPGLATQPTGPRIPTVSPPPPEGQGFPGISLIEEVLTRPRRTTFREQFRPFEGPQAQLFQELIGAIGVPTGVEEVRREIESDILSQTLADIERGTERELAEQRVGLTERGLLGPGVTSDIAEVALAQTAAEGARTGAAARSQLALAEIGRLEQREAALQKAYQDRFTQLNELWGRGIISDVGAEEARDRLFAELLSRREALDIGFQQAIETAKISRGGGGGSPGFGFDIGLEAGPKGIPAPSVGISYG